MKKLTDQFLSRRMIETRERGWTYALFLRRSLKGYLILFLTYALVLSTFAYLEYWAVFYIFLGVLAGCLLRDFGWVRRIRQSWPFNERITDWEEVERLANGIPPDQPEGK